MPPDPAAGIDTFLFFFFSYTEVSISAIIGILPNKEISSCTLTERNVSVMYKAGNVF